MNIPYLDELYGRVDFDRELVFQFFTVFSLFEYALKGTGFCLPGRSDEAQPNWAGFATAIQPQFNPQATPELANSVSYMLNRPVMRQEIRSGRLTFMPRMRPQNMNDVEWLSILIRGVRNNLFHGGKFRYDRPRDTELIQHSLIILEAWAQCHPDVDQALRNI